MRRLEALLLAFASCSALAQGGGEPPAAVTLEDVLRIVAASPRITASEREADAARAERVAAGALPNPSLSLGRSRPAGGVRTIFDASSQQQATVDVPVPIFGQREARVRAADSQVGRAESSVRLTQSEVGHEAALGFIRLLAAQEQLEMRRTALAEVQRIRGLVSGRMESGVASRYDLARADVELALATLAAQRAEADAGEQSAALAALAAAPNWRPRALGSLQSLQAQWPDSGAEDALARNPAARLAHDETALAEARVEVAHRERFPVPSISVGRTWTNGPFGAANFVGVSSEIPIFDDRRALEDKARAEAAVARERERATNATLRAAYARQSDVLRLRRAALARFEKNVFEQQAAFRDMAESAYRLGRGTLFELLDARRTEVEAAGARLELMAAILEAQVELRVLAGEL